MNLTNEALHMEPRWRAEEGEAYSYITISPFGDFRINSGYDYRHPQDERLYGSGNYFKPADVQKVLERLKIYFKSN